MTTYVADESGAPVCTNCIAGACLVGWPAIPCEAEHCQCACRLRAAELDDRPHDKLAVIANELDRERHGNLTWKWYRTCGRKRPYHCQLDANQAVLEAAADGRPPLTSYRCRYCGLIHLTSDLSETREAA